MFCSKCGDPIEQNETYCNKCGNFVGNNTQSVGADKLYNERIKTSYTEGSTEISVNVKNTSQYDLETVIVVAFMKNGKIISIKDLSGDLEPNESITEQVEIPEDWESENDELIKYDDIKIFINEASYHED